MVEEKLQKETRSFYISWFQYLTQGKKYEEDRVIELYTQNLCWGSTVMEYRKELRARGRGFVDDRLIIEAYKDNNLEKLRVLLSEKCLECLSDSDIKHFIDRLHARGWGIEKVLDKLQRRPNMRLLATAL